MARREPLGVWLHGIRVADITTTRPAEVRCRYTPEARERWPGNIPLLSCSLPLSSRRQDGRVFFSGLLPEGQHRQAMAAAAGVPTFDTFGMLERFGRDVAGALVIAHGEPDARPGYAEPYSADSLAREVSQLPDHPLGLHDDSELSIAGLQDKMLLVALDGGRWGRPVHGRPSTHILKVEHRLFPGMAEAEAACLRLARAIGLSTIDAVVTTIAGLACLIVSRFDRIVGSDDAVLRVHQEDVNQALGRDPEASRGRGKCEDGGGPALRDIAGLLDRYADDVEAQLRRLVATTTFNVCIGNADAHGKNVALLHTTPARVELAPLYDTVPTALWSQLRSTGAMAINGSFELAHTGIDDVVAEAASWPMAPAAAAACARQTADALLRAVRQRNVPEALAVYVASRCKRFLANDRMTT